MIKNIFWKTAMALLVGAVVSTGCSDDETTDVSGSLEGNYKSKAMYEREGTAYWAYNFSQNFSITETDGNHIDIHLTDLLRWTWNITGDNTVGPTSSLWGDVTLAGVEVVRNGDLYLLKSEQTVNGIPVSLAGYANDKAVSFTLSHRQTVLTSTDEGLEEVEFRLGLTVAATKLTGTESREARITEFKFDTSKDGNKNVIVEQPVIDEAAKRIIFKVKAGAKVSKLTPTVKVEPEGAWAYPGNAVALDFTSVMEGTREGLPFVVVAEDGTRISYWMEMFVEEPDTEK